MIPKLIHYCWFGRGKKPQKVQDCIASWKKYCPDYTIKEWNEDNFDINYNRWTKEAYYFKKYAFVADVARLHALYTEGGIYIDTDVELLKSLDSFLQLDSFIGFEDPNICINSSLIGSMKNSKWVRNELDFYSNRSFVTRKGAYKVQPNTELITEHLLQDGLIMNGNYQTLDIGLTIYPREWFAPIDCRDNFKSYQTKNTCSIHHFASSWAKDDARLCKYKNILGAVWGLRLYKLQNLFISFMLRFRKLQ